MVFQNQGGFVIGVPKSVLSIKSAEYSSLTTKEPPYVTENTLQQHSEQIFKKLRHTGVTFTVFHKGYTDSNVKISRRLWVVYRSKLMIGGDYYSTS